MPKLYRGCKKEFPEKRKYDLMLGFETKTGLRRKKKISKK
jgi:hypothetical protein